MAFDIQAAHEATGSIQSSLLPQEGELLYRLARELRSANPIVEIGSWKGRSTIYLGYGSRSGASVPIYAVDPHTGAPEQHRIFGADLSTFQEFTGNIQRAGIADLVRPVVKASVDAAKEWSGSISLLFIDGAHDYEYVRADFDHWVPFVEPGGIVAIHDTNVPVYPGVKQVVLESVFGSNGFRKVRFVNSLLVVEKTEKASPADRLGMKASHILRYPEDWAKKLGWGGLPPFVRRAGLKILRKMQ